MGSGKFAQIDSQLQSHHGKRIDTGDAFLHAFQLADGIVDSFGRTTDDFLFVRLVFVSRDQDRVLLVGDENVYFQIFFCHFRCAVLGSR